MSYYRNPRYGRVYGNPIATPVGRIAWPALAEPRKSKTKEGKDIENFEFTIAFQKDDPKAEKFLADLDYMVHGDASSDEKGMLEVYNDNSRTTIDIPGDIVRDGDKYDLEKYPYYANCWVVYARNSAEAIKVKDIKRKEIDPKTVVGGMLCVGVVTPHLGPTGISFKGDTVQLVKDDGVRFGGGSRNVDHLLAAIEEDVEESEEPTESLELETEEVEETPPPAPKKATPTRTPPVAQGRDAVKQAVEKRAARAVAQPTAPATTLKGTPPGAKVVTTGKGKNLALNNL